MQIINSAFRVSSFVFDNGKIVICPTVIRRQFKNFIKFFGSSIKVAEFFKNITYIKLGIYVIIIDINCSLEIFYSFDIITCFEINQAAPGRPGAAAFSAAVFRNCYAGFMCCFRNDGMLLL